MGRSFMTLNRRALLACTGAVVVFPTARAQSADSAPLIRRAIPSSGQTVPAIGLGTATGFQSAFSDAELAPLRDTIRVFQAGGGTVIDTSDDYGDAERVLGQIIQELGVRDSLFLATKVSAAGRGEGGAHIEQSFRNLRTSRIDL